MLTFHPVLQQSEARTPQSFVTHFLAVQSNYFLASWSGAKTREKWFLLHRRIYRCRQNPPSKTTCCQKSCTKKRRNILERRTLRLKTVIKRSRPNNNTEVRGIHVGIRIKILIWDVKLFLNKAPPSGQLDYWGTRLEKKNKTWRANVLVPQRCKSTLNSSVIVTPMLIAGTFSWNCFSSGSARVTSTLLWVKAEVQHQQELTSFFF